MYPNYVLLITLMCFCISVSSLAWFMSNQETSFVTIGQRVLANPLKYENLSLISCWYMLSVWVCVNCIAIAIWSIQGTQILPIWPIWPIPLVFQRIYKRYRSYGSNGPDSHSYTVHTNAINNINCTIVLFEWKFIQIAHGPTILRPLGQTILMRNHYLYFWFCMRYTTNLRRHVPFSPYARTHI